MIKEAIGIVMEIHRKMENATDIFSSIYPKRHSLLNNRLKLHFENFVHKKLASLILKKIVPGC